MYGNCVKSKMPKTPNGKKRKLSSKKQKGCKPKRLKFDDKQVLENEVEGIEKNAGAAHVSEKESEREAGSSNGDMITERDIDEILEENASRNNLTAMNVKSIIHHVLTDKRVLTLVQNAIAERGELSSSSVNDVETNFEPKMTRSKAKKSGQGDPISLLTKSPVKMTSKPRKHFMELELPEDSSDEEYDPAKDEGPSDDDSESCASFTSDLASPKVTATPERVKLVNEESPLVTRSLSKNQSQDQGFKVPLPLSTKENSADDSDLIAKRTRSRHPLTDTTLQSIEANFEPPDVIPELYEPIHEDELDMDDIEWQRWLQNLVLGQEEADDDNDDAEYNFMAEDLNEEQEEYRNDRAVRIPQKEVNELITELLNEYQEYEEIHSFLSEPGLYGDEDGADCPKFSSLQREELSNQLQMHTQLLTQVFLTSREEPTLQAEAAVCREFVNELHGFSERASSARLCMALDGRDITTTIFSFPGLDESVRIVNAKSHPVQPIPPLSPRKSAKKSPLKFPKSLVKKKKLEHPRKSIFSSPPELSQSNIQIMASSPLFKFTKLLPHCGMFPKDVAVDPRYERIKFTEAEDNLLALGIAQFTKEWDLIKEHLLPVKSSKQLQIRCKNLSSTRAKENIVKHFRRTGEMWPLPKEIESHGPTDCIGTRYVKGEPEMPEWLVKYKKQLQEQEKRARVVAVVHPQMQIQPTLQPILVTNISNPNQILSTVRRSNVVGMGNTGQAVEGGKRDEQKKKAQISSSTSSTVLENITNVSEQSSETGKSEDPAVIDHKPTVLPNQGAPSDESSLGRLDKAELQSGKANSQETCVGGNPKYKNASKTPSPSQEKEDVTESKDGTASFSRSSFCVKGKGARQEKTTGGGNGRSCGRTPSVSSDLSTGCNKKTSIPQPGSTPIHVLEPDPKGGDRAQAMAEGYLARVKKTLKSDPGTYEEFLRNLVLSSSKHWSSVQIFSKIKDVLKDYPDLVEDFIAFLEPEEAVEAGVLMNNLEFTQARSFLRKLEIQFQKSPAHFQKIIRALSSWNKGDKSSLQLYESVVPLLKGQQYLIDEFGTFFGELNPPPSKDADFEEVELGSGSESEMDDFEEVIIPDNNEPRKGKPNSKHRRTRLRGKKPQIPKSVLRPALVKNARQQTTSQSRCMSAKGKSKRPLSDTKGESDGISQKEESEVGRKVSSCERTEDESQKNNTHDRGGGGKGWSVRNVDTGDYEDPDAVESEQRPSCQMESSPSEGPFSNTNSMHTEWSNDSFKIDGCEAKEYQQHDSPGSVNVTDYEYDEEETQDTCAESDGGDMEVDEGGSGYENTQGEDSYEESSNGVVSDDDDEERDNNEDVREDESVSAKNLRLGQDGKLVLWTREDDRMVLQTCQQKGATVQTFLEISHLLQNKSVEEVRQRFFMLMKLFEVSTKDESERELGENGSSSEEDEESGTCDSDQEPV